jgi:putative SOS response-associated peptidase YedK
MVRAIPSRLTQLHDRMPVLLDSGHFGRWLDPAAAPADLLALLRPAPDDALTAAAVSAFVNSARHEGPRCVAPANDSPHLDRPSA